MGSLALITGAGAPGGIGMACARALGAAGYTLAIVAPTGRIHARAAELLAEGLEVLAFQGDLSDPVAVARLALQVGPVAVLVTCADMDAANADADPDGWRRATDASLTAAVLVTRAVLPGMVARRQGRVIMVCPVSGESAAFAAIATLTHGLASEVAAQGVTVNAVTPCGEPGRLAGLVAFLASSKASHVNGATLSDDTLLQERKA